MMQRMTTHVRVMAISIVHMGTVAVAILSTQVPIRYITLSVWLVTIIIGILVLRKLPFVIPEGKRFESFLNGKLREEAKELMDKVEALKRNSITDPLTGLLNRRGGGAALVSNTARCKRKASPISVVFLDIDDFKTVNDAFGHSVGDLVLAKLAEVLRTHLRISDVMIRWGGEEFLLVLPDTDVEGAIFVAHKLRLAFAAVKFPGGLQVTASFGCCLIGEDPNTAIIKADKQLYLAKTQGKNTVRPLSKKKLLDLVEDRA